VSPEALAALGFATGLVAGWVNVVAGGGTLLSLPVLALSGLPPMAANATSRLGVLSQSLSATVVWHRKGAIPWKLALRLLPVSLVATLAGAEAAALMQTELAGRVLAIIFASLALLTAADAFGLIAPPAASASDSSSRPATYAVFGAIGLYGGAVQAGVGLLYAYAAYRLGALTPAQANALKSLLTLVFSVGALTVFVARGLVDFGVGLPLALGSLVGGHLGATFANRLPVRAFKIAIALAAVVTALRFAHLI
jgi:uncharacterized membrane protein YfcA